jgi:hypothetical protein
MDKKEPTISDSRRKFINKIYALGASFIPLDEKEDASSNGKVKMLTADGKLVEVDEAILDGLSSEAKVSNKDLYKWINSPIDKPIK